MKKFMTLTIAMSMIFALSACSNGVPTQSSSEPSSAAPEATEDGSETDDADVTAALLKGSDS